MVRMAEAVPGVGLPLDVADLLQQVDGLLAGGERALVLAQQALLPADRVEGIGLARLAAGPLEQGEGLPGLVERRAVVALPLEYLAEVEAGVRRAGRISGGGEQLQRPPQVPVRVAVPAQSRADPAQVAVGLGLPHPLARAQRGVECDPLECRPVGPVTAAVEEARGGPGDLPGDRLEPGLARVRHRGQQHWKLGGEPRRRLGAAGDVVGRDVRVAWRQGDLAEGRMQGERGGVRGVEVVGVHPAQRRAVFVRRGRSPRHPRPRRRAAGRGT